MNNYVTILKALFKNKLRFDAGKSKRKKLAFALLLGFVYLVVMAAAISIILELKELFLYFTVMAQLFYFFVLMTAAIVVLFFGIVHLVIVLYLSKDTDFYSMLPVKPATVFAAKLSYVYLSETAIVIAVALPLLIAFGIVAKMWAWFYVIAIATLVIVPTLPLVVAAIVAIPVMLIASKLKNRNIISLVFFLLLFGGAFSLYIYFIYLTSSGAVTPESMTRVLNGLKMILDVLYPYTVLSRAACGIPMYGLGMGASTVVGVAIFIAISAVLLIIIWLLAKFMYAQSVKANNQTDNSKAKKGEFKTTTSTRALIKREYISSLRSTQIAFQCYAVMLLPILMAVVFGLMAGNVSDYNHDMQLTYDGSFIRLMTFCMLAAMLATLGNGASTTFSREGNAMASLKILPVNIKTILKAKIIAWLLPAIPVSIVTVVIINVMNFSVNSMLLSMFSLVPIAVVFVIFGTLWDLTSPKLKWTDPIQAVKHNMHVLGGQLMMMGSGLAIIILMLVLSACSVKFDVINIVCWALLYAVLAAFAIADIVLYRKIDKYYNRLEM
ncbi:MAG: hypothetical protein K2M47_03670 [Clostridiales bacterium]|nr:hypothetical protein [Clostridiales bacterium]